MTMSACRTGYFDRKPKITCTILESGICGRSTAMLGRHLPDEVNGIADRPNGRDLIVGELDGE